VDEVQRRLGTGVTPAKTADHRLAGSESYGPEYSKGLVEKFGIAEATARHLSLKFGTRATQVLELAGREPELREPIVAGFSPIRAEIVYAAREEMAMTLDDVLGRRTGLQLLDWRAAREAAGVAGALLAKELGWSEEFTRQAAENYRGKITGLLQTAGLSTERPAPTVISRN
jgi:glycerol-3-phosphate dehydrogenase